jgi:frataxin
MTTMMQRGPPRQLLLSRVVNKVHGHPNRASLSSLVTQRHRNSNSSSPELSLSSPSMTFHYRRMFQTEADFHAVADSTLETIQETMELLLERVQSEEFEVDYASGVLTMAVPPHGTWVLNKQTPNRQIWWSSPVSGPRRYEYENEMWTYTRSDGGADTLGQALAKEMKELYPQLTKDTDLHGLLLQ